MSRNVFALALGLLALFASLLSVHASPIHEAGAEVPFMELDKRSNSIPYDQIYIENTTYGGSGCPDNSAEVTISPDKQVVSEYLQQTEKCKNYKPKATHDIHLGFYRLFFQPSCTATLLRKLASTTATASEYNITAVFGPFFFSFAETSHAPVRLI